jgi:ribulose-phosphate 3-epimerase
LKKIKIAPSLLSADFSNLGEEIKRVEQAGANLIHFDIMDGHFVPNLTMGPAVISALRDKTRLPFDVHLMILSPERYIKQFCSAGADSITFHIEAVEDPLRVIKLIREEKLKTGVAINPSTEVQRIEQLLDKIDMVVVMTVNPGFSGQKFIQDAVPKIKWLKDRRKELSIEVDGGINSKTIGEVVMAGADIIVAGSAIFEGGKPQIAIQKLIQIAEKLEVEK